MKNVEEINKLIKDSGAPQFNIDRTWGYNEAVSELNTKLDSILLEVGEEGK